jgi:geranylgeranyl diphosphate synthase type I
MSTASSIAQRVDVILGQAISQQRQLWENVDSDLGFVFDEIESLARGGGKRLRPQFCHWGWVAAGGDPASVVPDSIGAAIELLHASALFHDDVIDAAMTRRGKITTHIRHLNRHTEYGFAGEARRFGEGIAILVGDITYVLSDSLTDALNSSGRMLWHQLRMEMNIGQLLDTLGSARRERAISKTELVSRLKTAKYTIERPLHIGAVSASEERGQQLLPMLSSYGLPLGDAFQMRDDILGAFGDTEVTGKPVGDDFREGKPTPLLARAYNKADDAQRKILDGVGSPTMTDADVAEVQSVVVATGALAEMEAHIVSLHDTAVAALDKSQLEGIAYDELVHLAHVVTQRTI